MISDSSSSKALHHPFCWRVSEEPFLNASVNRLIRDGAGRCHRQRMWLTMSSSSRSQYLQTTRRGFFERTTNDDSIGSRTFEKQFGFAHRRMATAPTRRASGRFLAAVLFRITVARAGGGGGGGFSR